MSKAYTVTKDINADYKKLRILVNKGIIKIVNIKIENNSNRPDSALPTGVVNYAILDSIILGSDQQAKTFEKLKKIIGRNNIKDCIHLEAHIREGYDYFVTEDHDIIDNRNQIEKKFKYLKIRTVFELLKELNN